MKFEAMIEDNNSVDFPYYWTVFEEGDKYNKISGVAATPREAKRRIKKAAKTLKAQKKSPYKEVWWFEL